QMAHAGAERLRRETEWLAIRAPQAQPSDRQERNRGGDHRRAHDPVHVEGIESEHLLDAEPRDHFRLHDDDAERSAEQKVGEEHHVITSRATEAPGTFQPDRPRKSRTPPGGMPVENRPDRRWRGPMCNRPRTPSLT